MQQQLGQLATLCLKVADILVLLGALSLTIVLNYAPETQMSAPHYALDFFSTRVKVSNVLICLVLLGFWHGVFRWFRLYEAENWQTWGKEISNVSKALLIAAVALLATAHIGRWPTVNIYTVVGFGLIGGAFICGLRWMRRLYQRRARARGRNLKSLLIIGGGARAEHFISRLKAEIGLGYRLLGYLESDPLLIRKQLAGVPWRGRIEDLEQIVNSEVLDEVVVALPIKSHYAQIRDVLAIMEVQGLAVFLLSDFFPQKLARYQALEWDGMPLLSLQSAPPSSWRTEIKRFLDFTLSLALLILLAPLFLLLAIIIKLDSNGPVFFIQERMGYNKRRFRMFKFRTMTFDAETQIEALEHLNEKSGPIFKIRNDPRITRVGRWLRSTSLDELPQLVNVFLGDMSLVGPRPLSLRDALRLSELWQKRRFSVKPGLTCLWQVSGRSNLSFEEWMQLDLEYIDHWTLGLDCLILLRTVPAVLMREGAM